MNARDVDRNDQKRSVSSPTGGDSINDTATYDLCIVGGGINGCGIARDAAGRGLRVLLCEQGDLAQATSSSSTKLFHGGLRYLEHYEFRLVREALIEREVLWQAMPHIAWPLRFVLPHHRGLRPAWLLRLGLFIYDHLGGRRLLPGTSTRDLSTHEVGRPLKDQFKKAFEYSDCWVDDARLVVLNARDAQARGAEILTRTKCVTAEVHDGLWKVELAGKHERTVSARALINAAGPWVNDFAQHKARLNTPEKIRLVRGSHIVLPKLYDHNRAYILQHSDGRVIFAIPYERDYTLVGTTDADHEGDPGTVECSDAEAEYLCSLASEYFREPLKVEDVVWRYAGVRPLFDDGQSSATKATRDYVLKLEHGAGAPLLNIFGGKITTYRRLAEAAMDKIAEVFPDLPKPWTAGVSLPGGDFAVDGVPKLEAQLAEQAPALDAKSCNRAVRAYGTEIQEIFGTSEMTGGLGESFGNGLYEAEVRWLIEREWACTADDILWRRSKLGLKFSAEERASLEHWIRDVYPDIAQTEAA